LAAHVDTFAASRRIVLCSARPDSAAKLRTSLGELRADALVRELSLFVRRILRGADVFAVKEDEIFILLDTPCSNARSVAERLLAAIRAHMFSAGTSGPSIRLTLSVGLACAPEHGTSFTSLESAARQARMHVGEDGVSAVVDAFPERLNLDRFVGRSEPLGLLIDRLDDAVRGAGHVVGVIGETGVGASTLVRALEPEVRLRGGSLVVGTCREHLLPSPYSLWSDVLRAVRRLPVKTTRQWRDLPLLDATLERAGGGAGQGGSKTRLLEELADFLRLAAQQRPLVLLLENVQWADEASLYALEYLITQLERERILIAITIHQGGGDDVAFERWNSIASRPRHHEIRLTFLTRDEVKRWLEATLDIEEVGREMMSYLYRQSQGRPLVLTHLLRDLEEAGHLVKTNGEWHWSAINELPAPIVLTELLARRLSRLAPGARALLEFASVLGRESDEQVLLREDPADGREDLRHLVAAGFLVSTFDRNRAAYVVAHSEIARVARERLSPERERELHAQVARAIAADEHGTASEIAGHFERAGDNVQAHRYALIAADDALELHETGAVAALLGAAERTAPTAEALAQVRVRMASLAEVAGRYEEAEALCDQALAWYEAQSDSVQALQLKRTRSMVRTKRGQGFRDTLTELLALEAEASTVNAPMERAALLLLIAQMHWRLGDVPAAQDVAEEAVHIAERGDDPVLVADACNRLAVTLQYENPARSRELFTTSLDIATTIGDAFRMVRGLNNIGVLEMISYNWDEARRVLASAADQARTAGLIESWGRAELNIGVLAGRIGDYEGSARSLAEALRLTAMVQNSEEQLYATYNMAHLERESGRLRQAIDTYSLASELAERIGQVEVQAGSLAGMGLCRLMLADDAGARDALRQANPLTERLVSWFQGRELLEGLRLHLMLNDDEPMHAVELFERSVILAAPSDAYGAAWLTAEFGSLLRLFDARVVNEAVERYGSHPEVLGNPRIVERIAVLKVDS
jgi:tetratricopeptide (TPR) repeat protein/GGDEF domain-containing protein